MRTLKRPFQYCICVFPGTVAQLNDSHIGTITQLAQSELNANTKIYIFYSYRIYSLCQHLVLVFPTESCCSHMINSETETRNVESDECVLFRNTSTQFETRKIATFNLYVVV